jgi:hypothetical protein
VIHHVTLIVRILSNHGLFFKQILKDLFKIKVFYINIYINNSTFLKLYTKLIILIFSAMKRFNLINLIFATLLLFIPMTAKAEVGGLTM